MVVTGVRIAGKEPDVAEYGYAVEKTDQKEEWQIVEEPDEEED